MRRHFDAVAYQTLARLVYLREVCYRPVEFETPPRRRAFDLRPLASRLRTLRPDSER